MTPTFLGMTRPRFTPGRALGAPRVLVLHATAGSHPGDRDWLRKGGADDPALAVSCHYLFAPDGSGVQFVHEADTAWHCGASSWVVDGVLRSGSHKGVATLNHLSIGIELSNPEQSAARYPDAQLEPAVALARSIVRRLQIPRSQFVRHLDIAPGRKTDPRGLSDAGLWRAVVDAVYAETPTRTRVIGTTPSATFDQFWAWLKSVQAPIIEEVARRVYLVAMWLDIDPAFVAAIWKHETMQVAGRIASSDLFVKSNNPGGIKAYSSTDNPRWPLVKHNNRLFNVYESPQLGLFALVLHLKQIYGARGLLDVETIIPVWAPSDDANNPDSYQRDVLRVMAAIQGMRV